MEQYLPAAVVVLVIVLIAVIVAWIYQSRKQKGNEESLSTPLQNLTQSIGQVQTQIATVAEKVSHVEPAVDAVNAVKLELRGLAEKLDKVERNQLTANQGIGSLETGLAKTENIIASKVGDVQHQSTESLHSVDTGLHNELSKVLQELATLKTSTKDRQEIEQRTADSIVRVERIIAGTQSKGNAGENILESVFANLPIEWQVRNFTVAGKPVEFGLKLPNGLILPIDSKWPATELLERFLESSDPAEQQQLKTEIQGKTLQKAKEVRKYIHPGITMPFGVAVVPDAVFDLSAGVRADIFQLGVVLISHSMFVPYLLLVFQTVLKTSQSVDLQKLDAYIQTAQDSVKAIQDELDGRFSKAMTMMNNSRDDMRAHMSKASTSLTSLQITASAESPVAELGEGAPVKALAPPEG